MGLLNGWMDEWVFNFNGFCRELLLQSTIVYAMKSIFAITAPSKNDFSLLLQ